MRSIVVLIFALHSIASSSTNVLKGDDASIAILFGGDTSHGENYQEEYASLGQGNVLEQHGYDYSLKHLKSLLQACDYNILNLETPLTNVREILFQGKGYYHYSNPVQAADSLKRHRVHAVSLANNHALDFGTVALEETLSALHRVDIHNFGAGRNLSSAEKPLIKQFDVGDHRFTLVVIGVFEYRESYEKFDFYASENKPGTCPLNLERLAKQIREIRQQYDNPFVVLFPHWGRNYVWRSEAQQSFGHEMINVGADLVIGHGAHCIQEIERYKDRLIFYSIGNFMFNSRGRYAKFNAPEFSMPLVLTVTSAADSLSKSIKLYPIMSNNRNTQYQPRFATQNEFLEIANLLKAKSPTVEENVFTKANVDKVGYYYQLKFD